MPYYFVYKPYGMLSQFTQEQESQVTLAHLDFSFPKDAYPVGRLDADSEGLLLITNDKSLNAKLLNPEQHTPKTYYAQVEGVPTKAHLEKLQLGVTITVNGKPYKTAPAKVIHLSVEPILPPRQPPIRYRASVPESWLSITLVEGKNRQVRKMCAAIGFPVLRLVRVAIEDYALNKAPLMDMKPGEVRILNQFVFSKR